MTLFWDDEVGEFPEWIYDPNDRARWRELTLPGCWYVYVMFGAGGCDPHYLYIGMTNNIARRLGQHARSKPWWPQIGHIIVGRAESEAAARIWERSYIGRTRPAHNIVGVRI